MKIAAGRLKSIQANGVIFSDVTRHDRQYRLQSTIESATNAPAAVAEDRC